MSQMLLSVAILVAVNIPPSTGGHGTITRLDGSTIRSAKVDGIAADKSCRCHRHGNRHLQSGPGRIPERIRTPRQGKNLPLTVDSVMSAASFSKVAFAYLVMQPVDESVLNLDKPIYQYLPKPLPEYPLYADLANDTRYKQITTRMVLSHTFPQLTGS